MTATLLVNVQVNTFSAALYCLYPPSSRMKAMVEAPHRPTMQQIQARRKGSITEKRLSKRLGMSLPNLREDQIIGFQRNTPLSKISISDPGETPRVNTQLDITLD